VYLVYLHHLPAPPPQGPRPPLVSYDELRRVTTQQRQLERKEKLTGFRHLLRAASTAPVSPATRVVIRTAKSPKLSG